MISARRMTTSKLPGQAPGPTNTLSSALRIIAERSTKGETRDLLLEDLASQDKDRRDRALSAMHFLVSNRARKITQPVHTRLKNFGILTSRINQWLEPPCVHDYRTSLPTPPSLIACAIS